FLNRHGIETWYDLHDVLPADKWDKMILNAMEGCDWFLVVLSPRSEESEHVKDEVCWPIESREDNIIRVLRATGSIRKIHLRMARIQFVDFRSDLSDARRRLLATWGISVMGEKN